jgi:branched-chain amino acid transport system ATP-binding protein
VADSATVVEKGRVVWSGTMVALRADEAARTQYLAV